MVGSIQCFLRETRACWLSSRIFPKVFFWDLNNLESQAPFWMFFDDWKFGIAWMSSLVRLEASQKDSEIVVLGDGSRWFPQWSCDLWIGISQQTPRLHPLFPRLRRPRQTASQDTTNDRISAGFGQERTGLAGWAASGCSEKALELRFQ